MTVTGERAVTADGGFNPSWQRHRANYALAVRFLGGGRVLDLGCGVGHSIDLLAPRESVGVDRDAAALAGQPRETRVCDMRELPFEAASFASVLAMHSIEHVPDPERVVAEARRVLEPDGVAVLTTPNRLTFARPNEIIDPYHYVELDPDELRELCGGGFGRVEVRGIFGSERYLRFAARERRKLDALLRRDPFALRRLVPRAARRRLYDRRLTRERTSAAADATAITLDDFELRAEGVARAQDLVAVCRP